MRSPNKTSKLRLDGGDITWRREGKAEKWSEKSYEMGGPGK
mgnify:CR=1 FL=1